MQTDAEKKAQLAKIKAAVPDDVLVLPAHNDCFRGLHLRIDALERGQETALRRLRRSLDPRRGCRTAWPWPDLRGSARTDACGATPVV